MDHKGGRNQLNCYLIRETLNNNGEVLKKTIFKNASLLLGRNELGGILLTVAGEKFSETVLLENYNVHNKFLKDGKASIVLNKEKIQYMVSNCPPEQLFSFLKTLFLKHETLKEKKQSSPPKKKLFASLTRCVSEVSPLTNNDMNILNKLKTLKPHNSISNISKQMKRKCEITPDNKENFTQSPSSTSKPQAKRQLEFKKQAPVTEIKNCLSFSLTAEQNIVFEAILKGHNVFFTGSAGTGKSLILSKIIGVLPPDNTFITASTGLAACNIKGTTIHAFAGMGLGEGSIEQCVELASRTSYKTQWKQCKHLIIDEISMLNGEFFNKLESVARLVRKCSKPFGGIQLIVCGDFLQLPPVTKPGKSRMFAFQSSAWRRCFTKSIVLKEVHRQADKHFVNILNEIRSGRCSKDAERCLQLTSTNILQFNGILATRLCTHKEDVNAINKQQLDKIKEPSRTYQSIDDPPNMSTYMDTSCPAPSIIELKVGAQVTLTKNLDIQRGLVNGARGVVTGFQSGINGCPVIRLVSGAEQVVMYDKWTMKIHGGLNVHRKQLPLKLAWALSIHKSQGMTLDAVEMSLSRVFETGQAYVALSRAKNLKGLRVIDFDRNCIRADSTVLDFYDNLSSY